MNRLSVLILTSALTLGAVGRAAAQMPPPPGPGQMPPAMAEMQKELSDLTKETSPELYAFQEQLKALDAKIAAVVKSFGAKEIDKKKAKEELLPLVKEQKAIQNDPAFLVEQRMMQAYYSSPDYQAKAQAIRNKYNAQMHQAAPVMTPAKAPAPAPSH